MGLTMGQRKAGRVQPTLNHTGGNDDNGLEAV
jgi:hypothetical protein